MKKSLLFIALALLLLCSNVLKAADLHTYAVKAEGFKSETNLPIFYKGQTADVSFELRNHTEGILEGEYQLKAKDWTSAYNETIDLGYYSLNPSQTEWVKEKFVYPITSVVAIELEVSFKAKGTDTWIKVKNNLLNTVMIESFGQDVYMTGDIEVQESVKKDETFTIKLPVYNTSSKPVYFGLYTSDGQTDYYLAGHLETTNVGDEYSCKVPKNIVAGSYYLIPLLTKDWELAWLPNMVDQVGHVGYISNNNSYKQTRTNFVIENEGYTKISLEKFNLIPTLNEERNAPFVGQLTNLNTTNFSGSIGVALEKGDGSMIIGEQEFVNIPAGEKFNIDIKTLVPESVVAESVVAGKYPVKLQVKTAGKEWIDVEVGKSLPDFQYPYQYTVRPTLAANAVPQMDLYMRDLVSIGDNARARLTVTNPTDQVITGYAGFEIAQIAEHFLTWPSFEGVKIDNFLHSSYDEISLQPGETKTYVKSTVKLDRGRYTAYPIFLKDTKAPITRVGNSLAPFGSLAMYPLYEGTLMEDLATTQTEVEQLEEFDIIANIYDPNSNYTPTYGLYKLEEATRSSQYKLVYKFEGHENVSVPISVPVGTYTIILGQDETVDVNFENQDKFQGIDQGAELFNRHISNFVVKESTITSIENQEKGKLNIYPNPVKDVLNIKSEEAISSVEIFTTVGALVLKDVVEESEKAIEMSHLPKGMYILKVKTEAGTTTRKVKKD